MRPPPQNLEFRLKHGQNETGNDIYILLFGQRGIYYCHRKYIMKFFLVSCADFQAYPYTEQGNKIRIVSLFLLFTPIPLFPPLFFPFSHFSCLFSFSLIPPSKFFTVIYFFDKLFGGEGWPEYISLHKPKEGYVSPVPQTMRGGREPQTSTTSPLCTNQNILDS